MPKILKSFHSSPPRARFARSFVAEELARWLPIAAAVGVMAATASALLLVSLNWATATREAHPWLILLLAPAGGLAGLLYRHFGASVIHSAADPDAGTDGTSGEEAVKPGRRGRGAV